MYYFYLRLFSPPAYSGTLTVILKKSESPPLRNILIVYYSTKFKTECPAKNGKNRRFFKTICVFEIIVYARLYQLSPPSLYRLQRRLETGFGNPAYKRLCPAEKGRKIQGIFLDGRDADLV
jgi:hypothetical protein